MPITDGLSVWGGQLAEGSHRFLGAPLLEHAESSVEDHDQHDRDRLHIFPDRAGDDCCQDKNDHQEVVELLEKFFPEGWGWSFL